MQQKYLPQAKQHLAPLGNWAFFLAQLPSFRYPQSPIWLLFPTGNLIFPIRDFFPDFGYFCVSSLLGNISWCLATKMVGVWGYRWSLGINVERGDKF